MKAHGALSTIAKRMAHIGHWDDVVALDEFVASEAFMANFVLVPAKQRRSVFAAYMEAHEEARWRKPVRTSTRHGRTAWSLQRVGELRAAARRHKGNPLRIARDMGISPGAAERAMRRYGVPLPASVPSARLAGATVHSP